MPRHPTDFVQWRNIDRKYKDEFANDPKNLRVALSIDGVNPFGKMSSRHSTWPVNLCFYNLHPWLCMKCKFIMMALLIQGPKHGVYLTPLVEDLKILWNEGVQVWDAFEQ